MDALILCRKDIHGENRTEILVHSPFCILLGMIVSPLRLYQLLCIILWLSRKHYANIAIFSVITFIEMISRAAINYQVCCHHLTLLSFQKLINIAE